MREQFGCGGSGDAARLDRHGVADELSQTCLPGQNGGRIDIRLERHTGGVTLTVADDGVGLRRRRSAAPASPWCALSLNRSAERWKSCEKAKGAFHIRFSDDEQASQ